MSDFNPTELCHALQHAVTRYDRKQENKRGYNRYALAIYLGRVDEVFNRMAEGSNLRDAICRTYNDRLVDHVLKAVHEQPMTKEERMAYGH